jgi:hypothetical protein
MCSHEDHVKDLLRHYHHRHSNYNGIIGNNSEYIILEPTIRVFSGEKLKLTYKGGLETVEMDMEGILDSLNIPKEKLHVLATLLGNFIVQETELGGFYTGLGIEGSSTNEKVSTYLGGQ